MTHPWNLWAPEPTETETNRLARALAADGRRIVRREDSGEAGRTVGTITEYDCGCERRWIASLRTLKETETLDACVAHRNLLTAQEPDATVRDAAGGK